MEIHSIEPFLKYFGNVRERTMRVARCVPPDKIDWSYAPGKFTLGQRKCKTPDNAEITTWKWLRLMPEHEIHHRGQIYLYLGMLGVKTPPLYGLTSEEVRARSTAS